MTKPVNLQIDETEKARKQLLERGENVTLKAIRALTGHGSYSTISAHLKMLDSGWGGAELFLGQFPRRVEAICLELADAMDEVAIERTAHMTAMLEDQLRALENEKSNLQHERALAKAALESEQRTTAELRLRLVSATQKHDKTIADLESIQGKHAKDRQEIAQLTERVAERDRRIEQLDSKHDKYVSLTKAQFQANADEHAGRVGRLEEELKAIRANELRLTEQLGSAHRQIDKLSSAEVTALGRATAAEQERGKLQQLVAELSIEQTNSKKREEERELAMRQALMEKDATASRLTSLQAQLIDAQSNVESLRQTRASESRSLIINLVDHARRVFEIANSVKKDAPEMQEIAIAQREIERLFGTTE
ncbi:hypothetical protein F2S72_01590 [Pseudomonas syringae pv. actinidiae]|nr:hypothetical protein [Pseudomonas syringae pv. actinidiae]